MIELQQLKQLVAISESGTFSAAAKELHISQPALTRSIQRLEQELSIALFERKKNRASLNEIGLLAVEASKGILLEVDELPRQLQALARNLNTISIGSCAPAPMWNLADELVELYPDNAVNTEIKPIEELLDRLFTNSYHLIITDKPVDREDVICRVFATEQLMLSVPLNHPLSSKSSIHLTDLEGITMLIYHDLGIWNRMVRKLERQHVHFIIQTEREVLGDLVASSGIPCFYSNMARYHIRYGVHRTTIPILDEDAAATFYICALPQNEELLDCVTFPDQNK